MVASQKPRFEAETGDFIPGCFLWSVHLYTALSNHTYCVGDQMYLQVSGGPIGLQLTGAVSRAYMMRWDRLYLDKVKKLGIGMQLYERYVDDSDQTAVVPPPGSVYNEHTKKVEIGETLSINDENEEIILARVLKGVANDFNKDMVMVEDYPTKHENGKMPVLDMEVWMDKESYIMHEHYGKPMSSKKIMHSESAISPSCKKSVHTQKVLRRLFNSSMRLDWGTEVAPKIYTLHA